MGLFSFLTGGKGKDKKNSNVLSNEEILDGGACPPCWGYQEYDGKYLEKVKDRDRDAINNNPQAKKAFVEQFVQDHVKGIKLKVEGDHGVCPACKSRYKYTPPAV